MNKIIYILSTLFLLIGCVKEEVIPIIADFEFEVFNDDFSVPVQAVFFNRTEGGEDYEWTFEGGIPSRSVNRNPGVIQYNAKGVYTIGLTATNQDGSIDTKIVEIQIDDPVLIDFEAINLVDNFSPASYTIQNNSLGADNFSWIFEGGTPSTSSSQNPGEVVFAEPGDHVISLEINNGRETYNLEKTITVASFLVPDFDFEVAFEDDDFEIPVRIQFKNNSINATSYRWNFQDATITASYDENPEIIFNETGTKKVVLTASNGKETKIFSREISFFKNSNLRELKDIKLGINTAHTTNTIGSFYSISDRKVYTAEEITTEISERIDLVFFGLNSAFTRNRFVSPDRLSGTTFDVLQNPRSTIFINSQELCNCNASLTAMQFDALQNHSSLNVLSIRETPGGLQDFDNAMMPRIVLFQTQDGRKGAIKIKENVNDGQNSYVIIDIKVQKE